MDITQLPKGAYPQPPDDRDYKAEAVFGAVTVDWDKEFRLPEPPGENQGTSLSCVAQSWSYYHWQLWKDRDYSRRSLYSRIFLPAGGAYLRDGGKQLTKNGQATRDEAPDPKPQTEPEMRKRDDITTGEEASDIEQDYYSLGDNPNIDLVAYGIANYRGVVFGVRGTNKSWQDLTNPKIPEPGDVDFWYHALYGMGYHRHDGEKCLIAKSSWANAVPGHQEHHIRESYFLSGGTFNCWVLIPREESPMASNAKIGVREVPGQTAKEFSLILPITTPDALVSYGKNFGIVIPLTEDGKPDFAKIKPDYTLIIPS